MRRRADVASRSCGTRKQSNKTQRRLAREERSRRARATRHARELARRRSDGDGERSHDPDVQSHARERPATDAAREPSSNGIRLTADAGPQGAAARGGRGLSHLGRPLRADVSSGRAAATSVPREPLARHLPAWDSGRRRRHATALVATGYGMLDEAHALVQAESYAGSDAAYLHALLHRREAAHVGELSMTGFQNSRCAPAPARWYRERGRGGAAATTWIVRVRGGAAADRRGS